jgi:hypothetical protein
MKASAFGSAVSAIVVAALLAGCAGGLRTVPSGSGYAPSSDALSRGTAGYRVLYSFHARDGGYPEADLMR